MAKGRIIILGTILYEYDSLIDIPIEDDQSWCTQPDGTQFFSYLLTWEVDLIEILEIMPQMWQYVIFLSLKPTKVTSDFILN